VLIYITDREPKTYKIGLQIMGYKQTDGQMDMQAEIRTDRDTLFYNK